MLKKAFLVGINDYREAPLRGCVNDVLEMKDVLLEHYGFKTENLRVLTDEEATTPALVNGLNWLAEGGAEPAVRVFHYAGHGHFVPDHSGDEPDGADEALVPYDCSKKGFLIDDHLKELYARFPKNGNLTIIMDCCHSGTNQRGEGERDIIYRFMPLTFEERKAIAAAKRKFHAEQRAFVLQELQGFKSTMRGPDLEMERHIDAAMKKFQKQRFGGDFAVREGNILLAACQSDQKAADANFDQSYHGAFTHTLVRLLRECAGRISYYDLIEQAGEELHALEFQQIPQLECADEKKHAEVFSLF